MPTCQQVERGRRAKERVHRPLGIAGRADGELTFPGHRVWLSYYAVRGPGKPVQGSIFLLDGIPCRGVLQVPWTVEAVSSIVQQMCTGHTQ